MPNRPAAAVVAALAAALLILAGCATPHAGVVADDALPVAVTQALDRAGVPADAFAAAALPLERHPTEPAWRWRGDAAMAPASTMKLVTTIVALDRLGPNHRGHTELRSAAPLDGGVLRGDLVLRGGADAELGVPEFWAMLLELRRLGVETVAGRLVVDRTLFTPARADRGVPPFDESPEFAYNVIPDALQLAGGLLPLSLRADGDRVDAATVPPLAGLTVTSRMTVVERPCRGWADGWQPATVRRDAAGATTVELAGTFPAHCTQRTALQLIDRQELAARLFDTLWRGLGGRWSGVAVEADAAPPDTRLLVRRESRPWGELLRTMNKTSDNARTRLLYLSLGAADAAAAADAPPSALAGAAQPTTADRAGQAVRRWMAAHGIDPAGVVVDNGSGLSRRERIAPRQLAAMLRAAHRGAWAPELLTSLPVAGVDGTMRNRLRDSPAAGRARIKTGTLRDVAAVAGFVDDDRGRRWAVAAMVNHDRAAAARPALDAWLDAIARGRLHDGPGDPGDPGAPRPAVGPRGIGP